MDIGTRMASLQTTAQMHTRPGVAAPDAAQSAASEFEEMFMSQMVNEMLSQVDIGDFGGGQAEEHWRSFLAEAFGKEIVAQSGGGITASLRGTIEAYTVAHQGKKP